MNNQLKQKKASEKIILVVDDDKDIVHLLSDYLSDYNYRVISANSGKTAQNITKNYKVDLILSDVNMPDGNGLSLLHKVKSTKPDIPFFFITGKHGIRKESCLNQGALDLIQKPLKLEDLLKKLDNHFNPEKTEFSDEDIKLMPLKEFNYFWPAKALKGNQVMLGVNGIFLPTTSLDVENKNPIHFSIHFEDKKWCPLEFVGEISWQRKKPPRKFPCWHRY